MSFFFDFRFDNMATMETVQSGETQSAGQPNTVTTTYRYETTYSGNTGNDLGISTAGYRTGKHNPDEWHSANYRITYQSTVDREKAGKVAAVTVIVIILYYLVRLLMCDLTNISLINFFFKAVNSDKYFFIILYYAIYGSTQIQKS